MTTYKLLSQKSSLLTVTLTLWMWNVPWWFPDIPLSSLREVLWILVSPLGAENRMEQFLTWWRVSVLRQFLQAQGFNMPSILCGFKTVLDSVSMSFFQVVGTYPVCYISLVVCVCLVTMPSINEMQMILSTYLMATVPAILDFVFHFARIFSFITKLFLGGFTGLPHSPTFLHTKDLLELVN